MKHAIVAVAAAVILVLPLRAFAQPAHADSPKATVTVIERVVVGSATLQPGEYKVQCRLFEGKTFLVVSSGETGKEIVRVPCEREILSARVTETELRASARPDGTRALESVRIKGELVAHRLIAD